MAIMSVNLRICILECYIGLRNAVLDSLIIISCKLHRWDIHASLPHALLRAVVSSLPDGILFFSNWMHFD